MNTFNFYKRVEQKYILNNKEYTELLELFNKYLIHDLYYESNIFNIYFDNSYNDMIISAIDGNSYKVKVRLRSYKEIKDDSVYYLELKKKYNGTNYKKRVLSTDINNIVYKEIYNYINKYKLEEYVFIGYDRLSFKDKLDDTFRITIDSNLHYRFDDIGLYNSNKDKYYFKDESYIMEIKSLKGIPLWLSNYLNKNKVFPIEFSKVKKIYEKENRYVK